MTRSAALGAAPFMPSGVVTFLFTDVVGSTRLFQEHGDTFVAALQRVQDVVRAAVEDAGGVVVGTEGDGTFAAFQDAADGLRAGVEAQRAVTALDGRPRLSIRAGVHTGYAQPLQGDYLAVPVHVASRVTSAAAAGQLLVSGETLAGVGTTPLEAVDLGLFELRDVVDPVRLYRVAGPPDPPRASSVRRTNVQPPHTSLVGRDEVLAEVADLLAGQRLVTLVGSGGVGKTRVASELAVRLAPSFAGGAWLVELAGVERDDAVAVAVRGVLAVPAADAADDALLAELSRRGPTLIVLDNCEHVLDGAADLVDHLLRSSPTTRLIATSREALELADERVVRLRPLPPAAGGDGPAEQLFRQRAERAGAAIAAGDNDLVRDVCQLLDGLPLAIELAASRAASMPLVDLRAALERDAHLVPLAHRRGERRQRGLADLVDWSVRLLTPAERNDLMCLSAFPARFTGADADALLGAARGSGPTSIGELVRRGLVDLDGDRYRLLFSVRVPMANRLAADSSLAEATDAALVAWANQRVATARAAGWRGALEDLAPERANLEAALRAALRRGLNAPRVLQMLDRIWDRDGTGMPADVREALDARLAVPLPHDGEGLSMVLSIVNVLRPIGMSDAIGRWITIADQVTDAVRRLRDVELLADALSTLAPVLVGAGQIDRARSMFHEAIGLADQGGLWHRPARDLVNMAVTHHLGTTPLDALPWYESAVEVARRTADEDNFAVALVNMGDVLMMAGQLRQASDALRRGLKAMAHMSRSETVARGILADVLVRLDEPNSLEFAREAERDLTDFTRLDDSMTDYLERLRITIAAAEQRAGRV
jgi:class 3 adenylate cyclase/tetratricopeptide (TPR) repeat protein